MGSKIFGTIADLLFPRVCHLCDVTLGDNESYVCTSCLSRLQRTGFHRIPDNQMEQRFVGLLPYRRGAGHFFYSRDSDIAVLMQDLKYRHYRGLARYLGEVMAMELLPTGFLNDIDGIVPMPMHSLKKARRGYNQAEELAAGVSKISGLPIYKNVYSKRRHATQTSKTLEERRRNTRGVFAVRNAEELEGKRLLLLDDVCTTGSSLLSLGETITAKVSDVELVLLTLAVTI